MYNKSSDNDIRSIRAFMTRVVSVVNKQKKEKILICIQNKGTESIEHENELHY